MVGREFESEAGGLPLCVVCDNRPPAATHVPTTYFVVFRVAGIVGVSTHTAPVAIADLSLGVGGRTFEFVLSCVEHLVSVYSNFVEHLHLVFSSLCRIFILCMFYFIWSITT